MRNILLITIFSFVLLSQNKAYSQTSGLDFFPMEIGNKYIYLKITSASQSSPDTSTTVFNITDTLIANNKKYYYFDNNPFSGNGWFRVDSNTGSLYKLDSGNVCNYYNGERFIDSLSSKVGDYITGCGNPSYPFTICDRYDTISFFNLDSEHKSYYYQYSVGSHGTFQKRRDYTQDFGLTYYYNYSSGTFFYSSVKYLLKGAVINGILYGDTSTTSLTQISSEAPLRFSLLQNYPNPFNPATTISFNIPRTEFISLKIYNIIGVEIKTLVYRKLNTGNYEFFFNGEGLPSGTYYYTLKAGDFVETKKMMLVK